MFYHLLTMCQFIIAKNSAYSVIRLFLKFNLRNKRFEKNI